MELLNEDAEHVACSDNNLRPVWRSSRQLWLSRSRKFSLVIMYLFKDANPHSWQSKDEAFNSRVKGACRFIFSSTTDEFKRKTVRTWFPNRRHHLRLRHGSACALRPVQPSGWEGTNTQQDCGGEKETRVASYEISPTPRRSWTCLNEGGRASVRDKRVVTPPPFQEPAATFRRRHGWFVDDVGWT